MTVVDKSSPWAWLAHIRSPQGRRGEVFADILTDFPEKFTERRHLWLVRENTPAGPGAKSISKPGTPGPSHSETGEISFRTLQSSVKPPGAPGPSHLGTGEASSTYLQFPVEVHLINHWLHKGGIVLHFEGVDSISAAELLKGLYVAIPSAERAALTGGEAYISDITGCVLVDVATAEPQVVGPIQDVDCSSGPAPLLIVSSPGGEILIPFAKDYLRRIDLENRRIEMALPEGLVDLNVPGE